VRLITGLLHDTLLPTCAYAVFKERGAYRPDEHGLSPGPSKLDGKSTIVQRLQTSH
jgi:hypothetical protein